MPGGLGSVPDAQPGSGSLGRLPRGLSLLLRHAPVLGSGRHRRHPGAGTAGERERHGNVSQVWETKYVIVGSGVLGMFVTCGMHAENRRECPLKVHAFPFQEHQGILDIHSSGSVKFLQSVGLYDHHDVAWSLSRIVACSQESLLPRVQSR